jgi:hypothetical protein
MTWTQRASVADNGLYGVTYGNGLFVAVGDVGTILTSPNGVRSTEQASGTSNSLYGVTYGNGRFVAVGEGRRHPHLPGRGELDAADLGDGRRPLRRDLRERPLRGSGGRRHHPHLPGRGELDGADFGDRRLAPRRDLRERPLRGGGGRRHHPHLPLNRRSPRPYLAPSPMGRGTLTRDPAGVGAPADLAGARPLVIGAPPLHKSALRENGGPAPPAGGVREASSPLGPQPPNEPPGVV